MRLRLLNAQTRKLEEFFEKDVPNYGILSHTWGKEEITFKDFDAELGSRRSSKTIEGCCTQALADGLSYVWIDTCCIDKSSSAELSEAINSMFAWYQKAEVCYIFLEDVQSVFVESDEFQNSRWFTRGWTLQELLAPQSVMFYNASWEPLKYSDHHDPSYLGIRLAKITGIRADIIEGHNPPISASVAERMSWASLRETTRVEDAAYCLLGLFGIAMPMIYGEGAKALFRLQEEIVRSVQDTITLSLPSGTADLHQTMILTSRTRRRTLYFANPLGNFPTLSAADLESKPLYKHKQGLAHSSAANSIGDGGLDWNVGMLR